MAKGFIRKMVGGWSLESKCLLLLGLALVTSIFLAFFVNQAVATRLVVEMTHTRARDFSKLFLYDLHVESQLVAGTQLGTTTRSSQVAVEKTSKSVIRELRKDMLDPAALSFQLLRLSDNDEFEDLGGQLAKSPIDLVRLQRIEAAMEKYRIGKLNEQPKSPPTPAPPNSIDALSPSQDKPPASDNSSPFSSDKANAEPITPPPIDFSLVGPNQSDLFFQEYGPVGEFYYYYHPVSFNSSCLICHASRSLASASEGESMPFRVLRVKMPYAETRNWTIWSYSIMTAVGLATLALSLFFIHWILNRLVIRPLRYLRDVSDEVSRGNLALRSEIDTDDEFYELSDAFNRMLRHLTETQVELQKVNTVLDSRVDQLAQVNLQLYEANRLKSDFLASMSHELRTPLNSILGFSDVLQGFDTLTEKQKRYAANIQKSGRLLLEMINDILDLAKVEAGKMEVRTSRFDLVHLVEGQCEVVRTLAEDKNIDLQIELELGSTTQPPSLVKLERDPDDSVSSEQATLLVEQDQAKIQQILTNLISNAIKFTPQGGIITVAVGELDESNVRITVADTGVGIAEHDHESIFEKFRQVRTTHDGDALTREYSGTGLGLSIVRELCRLLGGEITLQSQLGKGSTFRVTLPKRYEATNATADAPSSPSTSVSESNSVTPKQRFSYP
jgi:two-component system, NarL family, sensor histidine kinase BarA